MKKSLVALAALSATAAMAQVTLDGYMDRAYTNTSNTLSTKNAKTIGSQAGTTTFGIKERIKILDFGIKDFSKLTDKLLTTDS